MHPRRNRQHPQTLISRIEVFNSETRFQSFKLEALFLLLILKPGAFNLGSNCALHPYPPRKHPRPGGNGRSQLSHRQNPSFVTPPGRLSRQNPLIQNARPQNVSGRTLRRSDSSDWRYTRVCDTHSPGVQKCRGDGRQNMHNRGPDSGDARAPDTVNLTRP